MKIIRLFSHWFYLFKATVWLFAAFFRAANYFKKNALADLELPHPELLTSKEKRRLKHYFYGTTYLSIIFGTLQNHFRTPREKHLFSNLAALAYFFDDLADAFRNHDEAKILWKNNPEDYGHAADDDRKLALHFLSNVYRELPPQDLQPFKNYLLRVFNVETDGRQQQDKFLTFKDLEKITAEKGGCSVLMFRRILGNHLTTAEESAIFQFGYLIQLCDDIFDIWFDENEGIQTLPIHFAKQKNIAAMHLLFEKQVAVVAEKFRASGLPKNQIETSLRVIHFVVSVTRVCLRHYLFLEKNEGTLPLADRKKMVVDMEKWGNRFWSAAFLVGKLV